MGCTTGTLRVLSFILNFVIFIFGVVEVAANAYFLSKYNLSESIKVPTILGIVLGSLLIVCTIIGFIGAATLSSRLTWVHVGLLILLAIGFVTSFFLFSVNFTRLAEDTIILAWNEQLENPTSMTDYEIQLQCCGKDGPNDYIDSGLVIPESCYKDNITLPENLYNEGCIAQLNNKYLNDGSYELIFDWTVVAVMTTAVIVSGLLAVTVNNEERRRRSNY